MVADTDVFLDFLEGEGAHSRVATFSGPAGSLPSP